MEIEDVARIGLAARRAAQQQRELAVGARLLRQVVVDAEGGLPLLVHEVLGHRRAGVGGDVLERRRVGRARPRRRSCSPSRRPRAACRPGRRPSTPSGRSPRRRTSRRSPFWLMIVSMAIAVLPVLRSPMISSRWPRPIGIMASIALMPVCSGSVDRLALGDAGGDELQRPAVRSVSIGPLPSSGRPSGSTTRPISAAPTGTREQLAGAAHLVALLDPQVVAEDDGADRSLFQVEHLPQGAVGELQTARRPSRR